MSDDPNPVREQMLGLSRSGRLLSELFSGRSELTRSADAIDAAVDLHNAHHIDLLGTVTAESLAPFDGTSFFLGQYFYCKVIPRLHADVTVMMACVRELVLSGGADLAANGPNGAFRDWCRADLRRSTEVLRRADQGDSLAQEFATFALEAGNDVSTATKWARERDDILAVCGVVALGRMHYANSDDARAAMGALDAAVRRRSDDLLRGNALVAGIQLLAKAGPELAGDAEDLVDFVCANPGPQTQYCMARELWSEKDALTERIARTLLDSLAELDFQAAGTLRELDTALAHLLRSAHADHAIAAAAHLLDRTPDEAEPVELTAFGHDLLTGDRNLCQRTLVNWFLSASRPRCTWIVSLMRGKRADPFFDLDLSTYNLKPIEIVFLCRKAIGYLFLYPVTAASILLASLRIADANTRKHLSELLFDPLLINYGGETKSHLSKITKGDGAYTSVRRALKAEADFLKGVASAGNIKELRPTERHRQIDRLRQQEHARTIRKMTEEKSVFMNLVHRQTLLYGRRSVTYVGLPGENRRPMEMALQEHSFTFELPRMEAIDPFGLDYRLRVYRSETLKK